MVMVSPSYAATQGPDSDCAMGGAEARNTKNNGAKNETMIALANFATWSVQPLGRVQVILDLRQRHSGDRIDVAQDKWPQFLVLETPVSHVVRQCHDVAAPVFNPVDTIDALPY